MFLSEQEFELPIFVDQRNLLSQLSQALTVRLPEDTFPVRFVITRSDRNLYHCEVGVATGSEQFSHAKPDSSFKFQQRTMERTEAFNTIFLVPTGIGAEIGGHAGDSTPAARILATVCDNLITHPNVVNASDINELPENGWYVEGSIICRLLMGTIGLQPVRTNRVLVVLDANRGREFISAAIN